MIPKSYKTTAQETYRDHRIRCVFYQPDIAVEVDDDFLGFFTNTKAGLRNARNHIDRIEKDSRK